MSDPAYAHLNYPSKYVLPPTNTGTKYQVTLSTKKEVSTPPLGA